MDHAISAPHEHFAHVPEPLSLRRAMVREAGRVLTDGFFKLSAQATLVPLSRPGLFRAEVFGDIPYLSTGRSEHRLDVFRPVGAKGPLPVVFYVHGGGFRILSKDSHRMFGILFARRGYLVVNVSYRLAPDDPYPAAVTDVHEAFGWMVRNIERFGGDLSRLVLAGESAGANLVTGLSVSTHFRRDETWAQRVFESGVVPRAVLPACGMLQVSDPARFWRDRNVSTFTRDRLNEVSDSYLGGVRLPRPALDWADPVTVFEGARPSTRPLPAFLITCGTWDILLEDSRRLEHALRRRGLVGLEARYYPRELHAFHAFVVKPSAWAYWRHTFDFLSRHVSPAPQAPKRDGEAPAEGEGAHPAATPRLRRDLTFARVD